MGQGRESADVRVAAVQMGFGGMPPKKKTAPKKKATAVKKTAAKKPAAKKPAAKKTAAKKPAAKKPAAKKTAKKASPCLLYTSPSPRDGLLSRMPSSA